MKKILPPKSVTVGDHHSPLPQAVQACFEQLTVHRRRLWYPHQIRSILVRAVNWLGDAVLILPAIRQLKRFFPHARLTVLALDRVAPVFEHLPEVDDIVPYLPKPPATGFKAWLAWLVRLRRQRFDLAVLFPNSLESALVTRFLGVPHRVGYNTEFRSRLLTQIVQGPEITAGLHHVYRHEGILRAFGRVTADGLPELSVIPAELAAASQLLHHQGWQPGRPIVGLSPGAAYGPAKQWFPQRFAAVADALHREFGARIVLLGSGGDQEAATQVAGAMQSPAVNLAGRTDLRTALALLDLLDLLITNDSGLMHAAAALFTPLVALFGSTDPFATGPFTPFASVLRHPIPCSPCRQRQCPEKHYRCLDLISVADVLEHARYWLRKA